MTPYLMAVQFIGRVKEMPGRAHHPYVQTCHWAAGLGLDQPDETAWCGSHMAFWCLAWDLPIPELPARARSWLTVGAPIEADEARAGYDVVVLKRGGGPQPGPDVLAAPGHVGWFVAIEGDHVIVCGGNQSNAVTRQRFPIGDVLGYRRLEPGRQSA